MPDILFIFFWLGVFVFFWVVTGHGLWMLAAAIYRVITGQAHDLCPNCQRRSLIAGRCSNCGQSVVGQRTPPIVDDRQAVVRHVRGLLERGEITPHEVPELLVTLRLSPQAIELPKPAVAASAPAADPGVIEAEIVYLQRAEETPAATTSGSDAPTPGSREVWMRRPSTVRPIAAALPTIAASADAGSPFAPAANSAATATSSAAPAPLLRVAQKPTRTLAEMLQAFLEEKNIRWGEILAGLFIVISAVGLIISLRNTLKAIPYFPALMFMLFTVLFHGAGLYSLRQWKLHAVSRVVLVISLLLVSLSVGAGIVLSGTGEERLPLGDPWVITAIVIGLGAFSWVSWSSAKELVDRAAWQLFAVVMGAAVGQILINRWPAEDFSGWTLLGLAVIPLASFLIPLGAAVAGNLTASRLTKRRTERLLLIAGIGLFSFLVPLVLLLVNAEDKRRALADLAPLLSIAAGGVLSVGLLLQRKLVARSLAVWRTAGTSIAIFATIVLLALLALAWPRPEVLVTVGLVDGLALIGLAVLLDFPLLHAGGVAALSMAWLVGSAWLRGASPDEAEISSRALLQAMLEIPSAFALTGWNAIVLAVALFARRWEGKFATLAVRRVYLWSAVGVAAVVLALTIHAAFAPWMPTNPWPVATSAIFVLYAAAMLMGTRKMPHPALSAATAVVWWVAILHLLSYNPIVRDSLGLIPEANWLRLPTLVHALSLSLFAVVFARRSLFVSDENFNRRSGMQRWRVLVVPLAIAALMSSIASVLFVILPWRELYYQHAGGLATVAVTWLLLTLVGRQAAGVTAAQVALHAAGAMLVAALWSNHGDHPLWYLQGSYLVAQLAMAAGLSVVWTGLRLGSERVPRLHRLMQSHWPTVDAVLLPAAAIGLLGLVAFGLGPAIGGELGWRLHDDSIASSWANLATEPLAWTSLALLLAGFALRLWERFHIDAIVGLLLVLAVVPALAAGAWVEQAAAGSALRWGLILYVVATTALIAARRQLLAVAQRMPRWQGVSLPIIDVERLRYFTLALGAGPIIAITCLAVGTSLAGTDLGGPLPDSWFGQLGLTLSYGLPLVTIVLALLLYAVREQETRFAVAGAALFQGGANLALLLYLKDANFQYLREAAALSLHVNALSGAIYLLAWLGLDPWIESNLERRRQFPRWIDGAIFLLTRLVAVTGLWAVAALVMSPTWQAPWDALLAGPLSFVAVALNAVVIAWRYGRRMLWHAVQGACVLLLSLAALAALYVDCAKPAHPWLGFMVLETSWLSLGAIATVTAWLWHFYRHQWEATNVERLARTFARRGTIVTALAAALAVYAGWDSPWHPWYSLALIGVAQACFLAQGLVLRRQWVAYLALALSIATGVVLWGDSSFPQLRSGYETIFHCINFIGFSVLAIGGVWLGIEVGYQRRSNATFDSWQWFPPMPQVATLLLVAGVGAACGFGWVGIPFGHTDAALRVLRTETVAFVALTGLFLAASLWERRAVLTIPLTYVWGAALTLLVVATLNLPSNWGLLATLLAVATYTAVTSHLWKWGADLATLGLRLGISDPVAGLIRVSRWLPAVNLSATVPLAVAAVVVVLTFPERDMRMTAAVTPLLLAWCLSSLAQERRKDVLLVATYLCGALAATCLGWADLQPTQTAFDWLVRTIRLLMALSFATLLYGLVVPRFFFTAGDWHVAARRAGGITGAAALLALVAVLAQEVALFEPGIGVGLNIQLIVAVSVVLVALMVGFFSMALLPGRDPLGLSESGRMCYVYAGEATAALLFAHLYLVQPGLFDHTLRPYWPYIIVLLAFGSVGLGEVFQRSGIRVLAQPLERTGGLLPLLPALGMWFLASRTDYSAVLFAIGLLYLIHSWLRQSLTSGLAAAIAGNAALWVWLSREEGRSFLSHPQLWLIPPALSVLLAAHLQRRRLEPAALTAIRYAATLVIYLSSTGEMFIVGIGQSLWPPMVLASLGLAGAVAGMVLQIRAFLYLGLGFVLLALVSMVAHAAQAIDHVWPWWAFGIGVGLAILIFFGIFEKKRAEVTLLVERLRQWT